jgi:predicted transcriptional regulator
MDLEMKIRELMKPNPMIIAPDESLGDVSKKMANKGKDIVVVEDDGIVLGLVTASDIYFAMKSYVLGKNMLENIPMEIRNIKINELMKVPQAMKFMEACGLTGFDMCIVLSEDDNAADAIRVMAVSGIDHILIYDENGITGTLSDNDLLKVLK